MAEIKHLPKRAISDKDMPSLELKPHLAMKKLGVYGNKMVGRESLRIHVDFLYVSRAELDHSRKVCRGPVCVSPLSFPLYARR